MRTNSAIAFAWIVLLATLATGCTGKVGASGDSEKDQARLKIKGSPGREFSGFCTIGDKESEEISGEVPKSITYDLKGRSLDCEVSSDGDLRVELTVGKNVHVVQSISGGTLNLTYKNGSICSVTSSSSSSSIEESSSSSGVASRARFLNSIFSRT